MKFSSNCGHLIILLRGLAQISFRERSVKSLSTAAKQFFATRLTILYPEIAMHSHGSLNPVSSPSYLTALYVILYCEVSNPVILYVEKKELLSITIILQLPTVTTLCKNCFSLLFAPRHVLVVNVDVSLIFMQVLF